MTTNYKHFAASILEDDDKQFISAIEKGKINITEENLNKLKDLFMSGKLLNDDYFNMAVIHETKNNLDYVELWLLINAKYDHKTGRFKRINVDNFSFGWQMQGGGTYPGEENFGDFINQGMNLWKANGKKAYGKDDPNRNLTNEDIGALQSDGTWKEFGIMLGWTNVFMNDSYGGMTIGGAGFEIDGNGMYPYCRVSLGKFGGGSNDTNKKPEDYVFSYCGMIWNAYHGLFDSDNKGIDSYFWGMEAPIDYTPFGKPFNPYSNNAELENAKFVIKRRKANASHHVEDWEYIFKLDISKNETYINNDRLTITKTVDATIVNKTDFNINYPDSTWTKDNTLLLAVKGSLEDGTIKQLGSINATYTDTGIFGFLGEGYTSAKIILSKI